MLFESHGMHGRVVGQASCLNQGLLELNILQEKLDVILIS